MKLLHSYKVLVVRDDKVECGEIDIEAGRELPGLGVISAAVLESVRRGEDQARRAATGGEKE